MALVGGDDGLAAYRAIALGLHRSNNHQKEDNPNNSTNSNHPNNSNPRIPKTAHATAAAALLNPGCFVIVETGAGIKEKVREWVDRHR